MGKNWPLWHVNSHEKVANWTGTFEGFVIPRVKLSCVFWNGVSRYKGSCQRARSGLMKVPDSAQCRLITNVRYPRVPVRRCCQYHLLGTHRDCDLDRDRDRICILCLCLWSLIVEKRGLMCLYSLEYGLLVVEKWGLVGSFPFELESPRLGDGWVDCEFRNQWIRTRWISLDEWDGLWNCFRAHDCRISEGSLMKDWANAGWIGVCM